MSKLLQKLLSVMALYGVSGYLENLNKGSFLELDYHSLSGQKKKKGKLALWKQQNSQVKDKNFNSILTHKS